MALIITADDLGISPGANTAILKGHTQGSITHASIMVNTHYFEDALDHVVRKCPSLEVGLHLNLTYGKAVSPQENVELLVNHSQRFRYSFASLLLVKKSPEFIEQVRHEIESQILKAMQHGIPLSHIDSHMHIHLMPWLHSIVREFAQKYNITRVREFNENLSETVRITGSISSLLHVNLIKYFLLTFLNRKNVRKHNGNFYSILQTGKITRNQIETLLETQSRDELVEIMLHPGVPELDNNIKAESQQIKKYLQSDNRKRELATCLHQYDRNDNN